MDGLYQITYRDYQSILNQWMVCTRLKGLPRYTQPVDGLYQIKVITTVYSTSGWMACTRLKGLPSYSPTSGWMDCTRLKGLPSYTQPEDGFTRLKGLYSTVDGLYQLKGIILNQRMICTILKGLYSTNGWFVPV